MKFNIITEKRSDAIGIYNKNLIRELCNVNPDINITEVNNLRYKNNYLNYILEPFNFILLYFRIKKDEILLFTDPKPLSSNVSLLLPNKKIVIVHHLEKDPTYYKIFRFLNMKRLLSKFDKIITISNFSKQQVIGLGIETRKIITIYNGINHNLFRPIKTKPPIPEKYILSIGSEDMRKNMGNILKAFQILKNDLTDLKLVKVGEAKAERRKKTLQIIKDLKIENDVIFTGYIEDEKLPVFYSNAELLLFPSVLEGFGFPIVEAMSCGCPVVTSSKDPMRELTGGTQLLVNPADPQDIAQKCKIVLLNHESKERMKRDGITRSLAFDWKKTAEEIIRYIKK